MIYKKLLKNIENKSITVERINTQPPLEYNNEVLSINENVLNQWNNYQNDIANLTTQNTKQQEQIDTINNNQSELGNQVQGIQGQINVNTNDISNLKTKDIQQDNKIQKNSQDITDLVNRLKELKLLVYKGQYQSGTTYKLGEIVSFEGKNYLCKVESTTNDPTNENDWDLWNSEEIDLSNYITTEQLNDKLNEYTLLETFNSFELEAGSKLDMLDTQLTQLTTNVRDNYLSKIEARADYGRLGSGISQEWDSSNTFRTTPQLTGNVSNDNDITNKKYVDSQIPNVMELQPKLIRITGQATISANTNYTILSCGWDWNIVSVNVYRKRSDGLWFLVNRENQSQVIRTDTQIRILCVSQNDWTREFKWEIYHTNIR